MARIARFRCRSYVATMPELPEVETVARQLAASITGRTIRCLDIADRRLNISTTEQKKIIGARIRRVVRRGKQVVLQLRRDDSILWLVVHLRMTGRLLVIPENPPPPHKYRARLTLGSMNLDFVDTRRLGTMKLFTEESAFLPTGWDPLDPALDPARLHALTRTSGQEIKVWLLRQDRLVGLGNIYASEILFAAKISPLAPTRSLDSEQIARLWTAMRRILAAAIENCGTTFRDFQNTTGGIGNYAEYLQVYGKADSPCPVCRQPIVKIHQCGRSTFYCATCQHDANSQART
jgi:formamidopyrimidine-DNA glycosylase